MGNAAPSGLTAVLDAIEAQRQKIRESTMETIRRVEAQCNDDLGRLDRAMAVLDGGGPEKPKRRRRARNATSPAATRTRREAVLRYLTEHEEPVARSEICRALMISPFAARTALMRLAEEGKVTRTGTGSATAYKATGSSPPPASHFPGRGTLEGRILTTIEDRASASLEELVQATGSPRVEVLKACGALVREEEVRMGRRNGRPVYIRRGAS